MSAKQEILNEIKDEKSKRAILWLQLQQSKQSQPPRVSQNSRRRRRLYDGAV
jgi:hypothetical protein